MIKFLSFSLYITIPEKTIEEKFFCLTMLKQNDVIEDSLWAFVKCLSIIKLRPSEMASRWVHGPKFRFDSEGRVHNGYVA